MIEIFLTQGKVTVIDDADFDLVSDLKWCAAAKDGTYYAVSRERIAPRNYKTIYMHRALLKAKPGEICDHRDGNGLNNRRSNIRITTHSINALNIKKIQQNGTGYRGVIRHKGKFWARIVKDQKTYNLGHYARVEDAGLDYEEKARELYGNDAPTSKIEDKPRKRLDLKVIQPILRLST